MTMMTDLRAAKDFLAGMSGGVEPTPVLAAVSGGLDSMCLLHLLSTWGRERQLAVTAAHFNHQLRGAESDRDEAFVRDWCAAHEVPFVSGQGDVCALAAEEGLSLEEAARKARYDFLAEQKQGLGCTFVLTAHHADDNAETMLLNLLRGTGLRGLTGIPANRDFIARPFLRVTRAELAAYAAENEIPYVEDSTNQMDDAARNVLRHKVIPVLKELNPRAVENMTRAAELLRRDEEALARETERLLRDVQVEPGRMARLPLERCDQSSWAVLSRAVWSMMARVCGRQKDLSAVHVEAVLELLRNRREGAEVSLPYGMTARREAEALVISRDDILLEEQPIEPGQRVSFGRWTVEVSRAPGGRGFALPEGARLSVTPWRREDRIVIPGSRGERSLKRLCVDRGISPAQRDSMPVLRLNGRVVAVPGIGIDSAFLPDSQRETVYVIFQQETEETQHEK